MIETERRQRRAWAVAAIVGGVVAGAAAALHAPSAAVVVAVVIALCLAPLGSRLLTTIQLGSVYMTRFRAGLGGFRFLPEHLIALTVLVSAVLSGQLRDLVAAARSKPLVLTGAFIVWGTCISVIASPAPGESLGIAAWLGLSWLIAVNLVAFGGSSGRLQHQIVAWAGVAAWIALLMYASDAVLNTNVGLQPEPNTGSQALYGMAWEANILASTLAAALFVALSARREVISRRLVWLTVPAMLGATLLALTRGAVLGLALGFLLWSVMSRGAGLRRLVPWLALGGILVVGLAVVAPATLRPIEQKLGRLTDTSSGTGRDRIHTWSTALDDVHGASWGVGLGLNSFGQRHLEPTLPDKPTPAYLGSLPLQVVYDTGLVGALLLAGALVSVWPRSREGRRRAASLLVVVLVSTTATSTLWFGSTWALVALAARARAEDRVSADESSVNELASA